MTLSPTSSDIILYAIDVKNKVATFEETYEVKGEYDEDLG